MAQATGKCVCQLNGYELKDANSRLRLDAILTYLDNDFDFITIEDFYNSSAIDNTKDDGANVISNYYDNKRHQIVIPANTTKTIRSKVVPVEHNTRKLFVHTNTCGTGSITCKISYDGGVTFETINQDTLVTHSNNGKNLVMQVVLVGKITLKSIYWGGSY